MEQSCIMVTWVLLMMTIVVEIYIRTVGIVAIYFIGLLAHDLFASSYLTVLELSIWPAVKLFVQQLFVRRPLVETL